MTINPAHDEKPTAVCPCCGASFTGDLQTGCPACGARAVGPPLAAPAHQLPRIGRATFAFLSGTTLCGALLVLTAIELLSGTEVSFGFWTIIAAAETIAWRVRWTLLPVALFSSFVGIRYVLWQRIAHGEAPLGGRRLARAGVLMSAVSACLVLLLLGVTIPERLRQRELAQQAKINSLRYGTHAAFLRYQARFGTLPAELEDLRALSDEDGTIARVLANFDDAAYTPSSVQAVARTPKAHARKKGSAATMRPAAYRTSNDNANDVTPSGLTFTNYDLVWYGADNIPDTEDDRLIRDGEFVIMHRPSPKIMPTPTLTPRSKSFARPDNR